MRFLLLLLTGAALLAGCGEAPPAAAPATGTPAPVAPPPDPRDDPAAAHAFATLLTGATDAVATGDLEIARDRLARAAAHPASDPVRVAAVRALLEQAAAHAARDAEARELGREVRAPIPPGPPGERAAALEQRAARLRIFLEDHPDAPGARELQAALENADGEARKHRGFVAAVHRAQTALDEKRWTDAIAAADDAYALMPREEARALRMQALRRAAPEGMVLVPGGPVPLGRAGTLTHVAAVYLDRTEVSRADYGRFLAATGHPRPSTWTTDTPPEGSGDLPVNHVTGDDAAAYAAWAGKRLPTEHEWEKAARGPESRAYVWGDAWDARNGTFIADGPAAVGTSPGDFSWYGLHDLGGNVAEYTTSAWEYRGPPSEGRVPDRWIVRGGHWRSGERPENNRLWLRFPVPADHADSGTGFRCAADPPR